AACRAGGAAGGADLRAGRAPGRGDVPVPGPAGRGRRAPRLGQLGDELLRAVAVVEVPAVLRHRPGACPGGPRAARPAGHPGPVAGPPAGVSAPTPAPTRNSEPARSRLS